MNKATKKSDVCVIIPVLNEVETIGGIVEALIRNQMDVVIIDDGSTDGSGEVARAKGAQVIQHREKKGKGFSLRDGFAYAVAEGYVGVITMDGDGQHDVAQIDQFLYHPHRMEDCVINGSRMSYVKNMPWLRRWTNRFMSMLISLFARQRIADTQCGFKYISCNVLRSISLKSNDFEIETEVLMKAAKKGYRIYSVDIKTIYGNEKSQISPFKDTVRFIVYFFKEIFS
jgi:glycosyltransferase involved in cell wall biosynthesis